MKAIRKPYLKSQIERAAEIWTLIRSETQPADRWLGNYFFRYRKKFGSRDRRFLSETIYALFRHKTFLAEWSRHLTKSEDPVILVALAAGKENLITRDDVQEIPAFRHVDPSGIQELLSGLSNGKLPISYKAASEEEHLACEFSYPLWLVKRWCQSFGMETCRKLLASSQKRPPLIVRSNPLKISRDQLIGKFKKQGFEVTPTPNSPYGILFSERKNLFDSVEFRQGYFEVQDEGSQLICCLMDPKPGELIWDVCAGGGGKSLLLAGLMGNKGRIIATDIRKHKLLDLKKRARRAGVTNIFPADLDRMQESREAKRGFDKILVDAPCSGTGTFRRNPDAKWKLKEDSFEVFHRDQTAILEKSLPYLKKGGKLYYATCSVEPLENELVMESLFQKRPELSQIIVTGSKDGYMKLLPFSGETDGFFAGIAENKI